MNVDTRSKSAVNKYFNTALLLMGQWFRLISYYEACKYFIFYYVTIIPDFISHIRVVFSYFDVLFCCKHSLVTKSECRLQIDKLRLSRSFSHVTRRNYRNEIIVTDTFSLGAEYLKRTDQTKYWFSLDYQSSSNTRFVCDLFLIKNPDMSFAIGWQNSYRDRVFLLVGSGFLSMFQWQNILHVAIHTCRPDFVVCVTTRLKIRSDTRQMGTRGQASVRLSIVFCY